MASSAVVGFLRVLLTADAAEFETVMKKTADSAKVWEKSLKDVGQQATQLGSAMTKTLTLPLVALGAGAIKVASDFESSFAGVRKTVDATEPEFQQLAQGLRDMAKEIPTSVDELNKVAESAGQLGIKKEDILQFTRTMADLGVTTNLTADEAATATAQIQNIFGTAGKDVDRFGATLVALGNAGASTEKDIISMGLRIAGAGSQVGLTQDQVLAFASSLSSVGINAEAGGSAISRVFLKINDAVAKGGDGLTEYARVSGMTAEEFKEKWGRDAAGATVDFIGGLARLKGEGENVNQTLEGLVGKNIIIKDTLMRASGAVDMFRSNLVLGGKAWQENTALTKEAAERYKTFDSQLKIAGNQIKDVGITLGTALLPIARDFLTVLKPVVNMAASLALGFAGLPDPIRNVAVGFAAAVAAAGPLTFAFGKVAQTSAMLTGLFKEKGLATRLLAGDMAGLEGGMGKFAKAGAVAAAAFAGWEIGRLIADLLGLDQAIERTITRFDALEKTRANAAQGLSGEAKNTQDLARMHRELAEAVADGNKALVAKLQSDIRAIESDQTRMHMLEVINRAIADGADQNITYAKAIEFNTRQSQLNAMGLRASLETQKQSNTQTVSATTVTQSLTQELADAQRAVASLTSAQMAEIAAGVALGRTTKELSAEVKVSEQIIDLAKEALKRQTDQKKDAAEEEEKMRELIASTNLKILASIPKWSDFSKEIAQWTERTKDAIQDGLDLSQMIDKLNASIEMGSAKWSDFTREIEKRTGPVAADIIKKFFEKKQAVDKAKASIGALSQSLANLAEITGGAVLGALGKMIGAIDAGIKSWDTMKTGFNTFSQGGFTNILAGISGMATGIAGMIGVVANLVSGWFGVSEEVQQSRKDLEDFQKVLRETATQQQKNEAGGQDWALQVIVVRDAYLALGMSAEQAMDDVEALWDTDHPERSRAAIERVNKALEQHKALLEKNRQQLESWQSEMDRLTEESTIDWKKMEDAAKRYGVDLASLGPQFQSGKLHDSAQQIWNDFILLKRGGADVGGILEGMQDEISQLVQDSIAFGTSIPENFRPLIAELIRSGKLVDENGNKITDMSQIEFGDPIVARLDLVADRMAELVKLIADMIAKLGNIPKPEAPWEDWPPPPDVPNYEGDGGGGRPASFPMMAMGGIVTRPTLAMVGERGPEAVIPLREYERERGRSAGMGDSGVARRIESLIDRLEHVLPIAIRDAVLQGV